MVRGGAEGLTAAGADPMILAWGDGLLHLSLAVKVVEILKAGAGQTKEAGPRRQKSCGEIVEIGSQRNRKGLTTNRRKSFRCKVPETGLEPALPVKATRPSTCPSPYLPCEELVGQMLGEPLVSQHFRADQITHLHCSSREVVRAVMWQRSGKKSSRLLDSSPLPLFATSARLQASGTFPVRRSAIPGLPPPPDGDEPHPWPALGEGQGLEVGPDLEPCWLDGFDGPTRSEGVVSFPLRHPPRPLRAWLLVGEAEEEQPAARLHQARTVNSRIHR